MTTTKPAVRKISRSAPSASKKTAKSASSKAVRPGTKKPAQAATGKTAKTTAKSVREKTAKPAAGKTAKSASKKTAKPAAGKTAKSASKKPAKSASKKAAKQPVAPRTAEEVFAEVEARAEEVGVELRDGASARELARTEKALGVTLPADVRAWYRRHDGSAGDDFPYLWPLAFIREQHQQHLAYLLDPQWFVLGGIEDSVSYIDLSPAGAGRIFHCSAESDPRQESDGFLEWLASFSWDWDLD